MALTPLSFAHRTIAGSPTSHSALPAPLPYFYSLLGTAPRVPKGYRESQFPQSDVCPLAGETPQVGGKPVETRAPLATTTLSLSFAPPARASSREDDDALASALPA